MNNKNSILMPTPSTHTSLMIEGPRTQAGQETPLLLGAPLISSHLLWSLDLEHCTTQEIFPHFLFSLLKQSKFLNLSNINAKLWKTIISENLLLKCMGINYWSDDMLNKKKETRLDKWKSFKVINIHVLILPHRLRAAAAMHCVTN